MFSLGYSLSFSLEVLIKENIKGWVYWTLWKQPEYLVLGEWLNKRLHNTSMGYYRHKIIFTKKTE